MYMYINSPNVICLIPSFPMALRFFEPVYITSVSCVL